MLHHYILVRNDLPNVIKTVQAIHAAGASSPGASLPSDTHAVCLTANDERQLLEYAYKLEAEGIPFKLIREPDPPFNGEATAIGVFPLPRERVRRILARLPLLRERT